MADREVDDKDIRSTVEAFEAARTAQLTELLQPKLQNILLVLDGSNQDDTSESFARFLAERSGCQVQLFWAYVGETLPQRMDYLQQKKETLVQAEVTATVLSRPERDDRRPVEQILDALHGCDLVVVCAPYQEDFSELGQDSVGSTLDILVGKADKPVFAVREPKQDALRCLRRALLPLTPILKTSAEAAAWSLFFAQDGEMELLVISPEEPGKEENAPQLVAASLRRPDEAGLVAAIQRRAAEENIACRVKLKRDEGLEALVEAANRDEQVVVIPCSPRKHGHAAYMRMQALLRASRNPLLVV